MKTKVLLNATKARNSHRLLRSKQAYLVNQKQKIFEKVQRQSDGMHPQPPLKREKLQRFRHFHRALFAKRPEPNKKKATVTISDDSIKFSNTVSTPRHQRDEKRMCLSLRDFCCQLVITGQLQGCCVWLKFVHNLLGVWSGFRQNGFTGVGFLVPVVDCILHNTIQHRRFIARSFQTC